MWDSDSNWMVSQDNFKRVSHLASKLAGLELSERHRGLLSRRIRRLGDFDERRFEAMLSGAEAGLPDERQLLLGLLTTKVTGFFRHPVHFDLAAEHAYRRAQSQGCVRLWSAAAATGEEPYSLAMRMMEVFASDNPLVNILATDLDAEALAFAERGEYRLAAISSLDPARQQRFLEELSTGDRWRMAPAVRRLVEFRLLNLASVAWPVTGKFDVIFCRNVLMYLQADHRYAALEHIASLLTPDGLLFLDPAEHLAKAAHFFSPSASGVYSLRRSQRGLVSFPTTI